METARRNSLSCDVSSVEKPRPFAPAKKMPVSAPRFRISCTASRAASVAVSEASIVCTRRFSKASTCRSFAIGAYDNIARVRPPWTPLSSSIRWTHGKLSLREDAWRLPDGREIVYPVLVVGVAVAIIPFVDDDHVLLVRQFRHLQRRLSWELPRSEERRVGKGCR